MNIGVKTRVAGKSKVEKEKGQEQIREAIYYCCAKGKAEEV